MNIVYESDADRSLLTKGGVIAACEDCGDPAHPYMIRSKHWQAVDPDSKLRFLCLPCFEGRFGRPLKRSDFMPGYPINMWLRWRHGCLVLQAPKSAWAFIADNYVKWFVDRNYKWSARRCEWVAPATSGRRP